MDFSKDQISSKTFSKNFLGGLNEFEVRDFLHVLAEQIRHLKQENLSLKKDVKEREEHIKDYRDREHILKESIANAERWAERIKQEAESHRQLLLEKAQSDSEALIDSARHSLQTVYNDIADLKRVQIQFKSGMKAALQVQLELLERDSIFNPGLLNLNQKETSLSAKKPNQALTSQDLTDSAQQQNQLDQHSLTDSAQQQNQLDQHSLTDSAQQQNQLAKDLLNEKELTINSLSQIDPENELKSLKESLSSLNKNFY